MICTQRIIFFSAATNSPSIFSTALFLDPFLRRIIPPLIPRDTTHFTRVKTQDTPGQHQSTCRGGANKPAERRTVGVFRQRISARDRIELWFGRLLALGPELLMLARKLALSWRSQSSERTISPTPPAVLWLTRTSRRASGWWTSLVYHQTKNWRIQKG